MTPVCRLFSLLLPLLLVTRSRSYLPTRYGELKTNHEVFFIGETVVFYCTVTDDSLGASSANIFIRRSGSNTSVGTVVSRDDTSVTVNMKVTSVSNTSMYYCTVTTSQGRIGLGNARIEVEHRLKPVTDFTCVTKEFLTLTCKYTLPVDFRYPRDILGQVLYTLHDYEDPVKLCYNSTERTFSLEPGHNLYAEYAFTVRLVHLVRPEFTVMSKEFVVDPMSVVVPAPVSQVKVLQVNRTSIQLSWHLPDDIHKYICNTTYTANWRMRKETLWQSANRTEANTVLQSTILVDLTPGTSYTVGVRCQALRAGQTIGFYSDTVTTYSKTVDDVPGAAPRVAPAVSRPDASSFIIYWQPLDVQDEHGHLDHYVVSFTGHQRRKEQITLGIQEHSLAVPDPQSQEVIQCDLHVVNNVGPSPTSSIRVTPPNQELDTVHFWVTSLTGEGRVTFHWKDVMPSGAVCTLFWCESSVSVKVCKNPITWKSVTCDLQNMTVETGHAAQDQLRVGISVKTNTSSGPVHSRIKWSYCIYLADRVPPAPKDFRLSNSQPPEVIHVEWRQPDCRENPVYISHYVISYCQTDNLRCTGRVHHAVVDREAVSYLIKGLSAVQYRVTIRAVSPDREGPESLPIVHVVEAERNFLAAILSASAVAGVLLIVGTVILCLKLKRSCGKREHIVPPQEFQGLTMSDSDDIKPVKKQLFIKRRKGWVNLRFFSMTKILSKSSDYHSPSYSESETDIDPSDSARSGSSETSFSSPSGAGSSADQPFESYIITAGVDETNEDDKATGRVVDDHHSCADASWDTTIPTIAPNLNQNLQSSATASEDHQIAQSLQDSPVVFLPQSESLSLSSTQPGIDPGHVVRGSHETSEAHSGCHDRHQPEPNRCSRSGNSQYVQIGDIGPNMT